MKIRKTGVWLAGMAGALLLWCGGLLASAQEPVPVAADLGQEAETGLLLMQAAAPVNVRSNPSARSPRMGTLQTGEQVIAAENVDGWFAVVWQDQVGYVNGKYLQPVAAPAEKREDTAVPARGQETAASAQTLTDSGDDAQEATASPFPVSIQGNEAALQSAQLPDQEGIWPGAPLVFIGDSRFVQMKEAVGETPWVWIAESGKGYDWFVEKGLSRADNVIGTNSRVIINLGVNDVRNADKYIALFNKKAVEWAARGARVYYASVNPVWTNPYVSREQVEAFNLKLQTSLNPWITWVDSYSYLQTVGCRIVDGLHYDTAGYQVIYAYYMEMCP